MNWELQDYLVAFNMVEGIGSRRLTALVAAFGSLEKAWHAPYKELIQVGVLEPNWQQLWTKGDISINPSENGLKPRQK